MGLNQKHKLVGKRKYADKQKGKNAQKGCISPFSKNRLHLKNLLK
jgi:hypothetical protein